MDNSEVAKILTETAQLLEIDGAIIGRYRSYERAAELIASLTERIEEVAKDEKKLMGLPGIGEGMAEHIHEILATGEYSLRKKLLKKYPATILDLLKLQGIGPKKAAFLWHNFRAATVEAVEKLAQDGKLHDLPGFGEKTEQNILRATQAFKTYSGRFHLDAADTTAERLVAHVQQLGKKIDSVTPAGSLRRGKETVGDLDLVITLPGRASEKAVEEIAHHVLKFPGIGQVLAHGENKVSFVLESQMQVDVRFIEKESLGAALLYFTGSKEHNVVLRGRANKMGYTLNEYALTSLQGGRIIARKTEEEIYAKLKLAYIEPELRENTGEIEAAAAGRLPHLVTLDEIRGDLQMHTTASDGKNSIEEMATTARELSREYIALTDHSKAVTVANGLDEKRTLEQIQKIHAAQKKISGIRILAGSEVDILKNGALDLDDEVLAQLDVVVCSVHSYMNLDREAMTERILAAIENPYCQIIAHPTGRLLLRRDAFDYDMERILDAAKKHNVAMECNSYPDRLDLKDTHLRMAKERGVKIVISTDSHRAANLALMKYGVLTARRGWLERKDVINTLPVEKFLEALRPKPHGSAEAKHAAASAGAATPRRRKSGK
jgi:DNA polymerase (family 10)